MPLLSTILWLPIAGAIALVFFPPKATTAMKAWGFIVAAAVFVLSLGIVRGWDEAQAGFQFVENVPWIPQWGISYGLGVDGITIWLVLLTTLLTPLIFLSSWNSIHKHPKAYVM